MLGIPEFAGKEPTSHLSERYFIYHKILLFKEYNSMDFSTFTKL